ncbi:MAG: hypothetical protein EPO21_07430 [Chloroflexota bacterium]|nr:MAG: hypothetical protein EPO21_07430 [Chloroflexota bacterium]
MKCLVTKARPVSFVPSGKARSLLWFLSSHAWVPPTLLVMLPLVLFWPLVVGGRVLYWGTPLLQFYPWRSYAAALYREGQLPLWNPYLGTGAPLAANLQSAAFYPINLLLFFAVPPEIGLGLSVIVHVMLAGLFTFVFIRAIGLPWWAALLSALSYMFSGYIIARAEFLSMTSAVPWLPLLLLAVEAMHRGMRTRSRRRMLGGALLLTAGGAMLLLAGHAQLAFYSLLCMAAYAVLRAGQLAMGPISVDSCHSESQPPVCHSEPQRRISPFVVARGIVMWLRRSWSVQRGDPSLRLRMTEEKLRKIDRGHSADQGHGVEVLTWTAGLCRSEGLRRAGIFIISVALAGGLSFGIAAVQLVPAAELTGLSVRAQGAERDFALTYSLWPTQILGILAPDAFGNPATGDYWGPGNYWEAVAYVGVLPMLLASLAVWRLRGRRSRHLVGSLVSFFGLMAVGTLLLSTGKYLPFFIFFYEHVPGFGSFQAPARLLFLYTFAVAGLAGVGLDLLVRDGCERAAVFGRLLALAGIGMMVAGYASMPIAGPMLGMRITFIGALMKLGAMLAVSGMLVALPLVVRRVSGLLDALRGRPLSTTCIACETPALPEGLSIETSDSGRVSTVSGRFHGLWIAALLVFVVADLLVFGAPLNPTTAPDVYRIGDLPSVHSLSASLGDRRVYTPEDAFLDKFHRAFGFKSFGPSDGGEVAAIADRLPPNLSTLAGIHEAYNYDPLQLADVRRLQRLADRTLSPALLDVMAVRYVLIDMLSIGSDLPAFEIGAFVGRENPGALPRAFVSYGAQIVDNHDEALAVVSSASFDPRRSVVLEGDRPSILRSDLPATPASIVSADAQALTIQAYAVAPGYLVLSDAFYPGWRAYVDGERTEILHANYAFRAVRLEPGEHLVEFRYLPSSYVLGLGLSLVALLAASVLFVGCGVHVLCIRRPGGTP